MSSPITKSKSGTISDWEKLPIELWAAVAKRLTSIGDYISFRGVCRCWRSAAAFGNFNRAFPRVPWLMYVSDKKEGNGNDVNKVTNFLDMESETSMTTDIPPAAGIPYLSWSGGILYLSDDPIDASLTHPIWRIKIELPRLDTFPVIRKLVLSGSPTVKIDLVVMVIWGDKNSWLFAGRETFLGLKSIHGTARFETLYITT